MTIDDWFGAFLVMLVLQFARHFRREWRKPPANDNVVPFRRRRRPF